MTLLIFKMDAIVVKVIWLQTFEMQSINDEFPFVVNKISLILCTF